MSDTAKKIDVLAVMERAATEAVPLAFALEVDDARTAIFYLIQKVDGVAMHLIGYGETAEFASRVLCEALDRVRGS